METKAEKFTRLLKARREKIQHQFKLLRNISNKSVYKYTEAQARELVEVLKAEVESIEKHFGIVDTSGTVPYTALKSAAKEYGEKDDCTVKILAILLGGDYDRAHAQMRDFGRKDRCRFGHWDRAIRDLGFNLEPCRHLFQGKTPITLQKELPLDRQFILRSKGHVALWDGRKICDWSKDRKNHIYAMWEVTGNTT